MEVKINNKTIQLNEVLKVNCFLHTENLSTLLEYLINTDKNTLSLVQELKLKVARLEEETKRNEEIRFRLSMQERKINEVFEFINDNKSKIEEIGKKTKIIDSVNSLKIINI
jgi:hypothetical protein